MYKYCAIYFVNNVLNDSLPFVKHEIEIECSRIVRCANTDKSLFDICNESTRYLSNYLS